MQPALLLALVVAADPGAGPAAPSAPSAGAGVVGARVDGAPVVQPLEAKDGVKGLRAVFDVRGEPDAVLDTLWDVRKFRSIFPDIKSLEVLSPSVQELDGATNVDVKFFVDAVFKDVSYTLRRKVDRAQRSVTWHAIGGDVAVARGSWSVEALGPAVSRVTYTSFVDVGYFVPTGMIRDVAMGKVTEMTKRVRAACAPARPAAP